MNPVSMRHETKLRKQGINIIAGVDEVGIGPLAGPVVACAVILREAAKIKGLDDSKKLTREKREELYGVIMDSSVSIGIGIVDNSVIDSMNILQASYRAIRMALESLSIRPEHILIDGIRKVPKVALPQICVKHGDAICSSIAAASIVAKVIRDSIMDNYDLIYPQYGFSDHKGYGTEEHLKNLKKFGPTSIHRVSYEPVLKSLLLKGYLFC